MSTGKWVAVIVFTDIVDSTGLLNSVGERGLRAVYEVHDELTRQALQAHEGRLVKALGDGFMLAFTTVGSALDFAADLHARLTGHPAGESFDIRIGMDVGDVQERAGDLFGGVVHAANRIAGRAGAGEVVVSDSLARLAFGRVDIGFVDLGKVRLRGFPEPRHLFRVASANETVAAPVLHAPLRVFLVDDEQLVRVGFRAMLEAEPDVVVVGEAADGAQAVDALRGTAADVVLMDMRMPVLDGVGATQAILSQVSDPPKVIAVTTFDEDDYVFRALGAGACAYLLKDTSMEDLIKAVRSVHAGHKVLHPSITSRLISGYLDRQPTPAKPPPLLAALTPREQQVLTLMAQGRSNGEIALDLHLGETTIKTHVSSLLTKLDVRDRSQAIVKAFRSGLMNAGSTNPTD